MLYNLIYVPVDKIVTTYQTVILGFLEGLQCRRVLPLEMTMRAPTTTMSIDELSNRDKTHCNQVI